MISQYTATLSDDLTTEGEQPNGLDTYQAISALSRRATSKPVYYQEAFRIIAESFHCPYAMLHVNLGATVVEDTWHSGSVDPAFWKGKVDRLLGECVSDSAARLQLYNARESSLRLALVVCPILDPQGHPMGAVAGAVSGREEFNPHACLAEFQALTRLVSSCATMVASESDRGGGLGVYASLHKVASYRTKHEMAFAITNNLRNKTGCEQVALGLVRGKHIQLLSISGFDDVSTRSPGATAVRVAMEECLDRGQTTVCQREDDWHQEGLATGHRLHKQWSATTGSSSVCSIPLIDDGRCIGVLSMRRPADKPFDRQEVQAVEKAMTPLVPGILLVDRADRGLLAHVKDTGRRAATAVWHRDHPVRKYIVAGAALAVLWFFFGSLNYRITVPCVLVPARAQHVVAPYEGVIKASHVTAGDRVTQGQALYEMDASELELERDRLVANIAVSDIEIDRAVANKSTIDAKLARAQRRVHEAQLQAIERKLKQAVARSGFQGTVVSGDLRQRIGQVIAQGEPVFVLAPSGGWMLELEVPESGVSDVGAGLTGWFASHARPEETLVCRITRVQPSAQLRRDRNVFVAEAEVDIQAPWMRPGVEGVASIDAGRRRVWWVLLHRMVDYVRLKLWV